MQKFYNIFKGDKVIWMAFFFLCIISILEVFSASSLLTYKGQSYWGPMIKHTFFIIIGLSAMICVLNVPCKYFKLMTPIFLLLSFVLLIVVLAIGQSTNGAARWIPLGLFNFQPSELAKGTLVLAVAQILSAMQTKDGKGADRSAFLYIIITCCIIIIPIFLENFSTAFLIATVVFGMMFIGRVPLVQLGKLLGVLIITAIIAVAAIMTIGTDKSEETAQSDKQKTELTDKGSNKNVADADNNAANGQAEEGKKSGGLLHRMDTWKSRIMGFFNSKEVAPKDYDLDKNGQVAHANIAIVQSNFIGRGPGNSEERDFLSQAFSDFIYAIIIEESGLIGGTFVALLYIIIFLRAGHIAKNCENNFPAFLAMGIGLLFVVQAMFNMCVAVGLAPVTGQPLPLISRGGTSTIINCVYIGVLLSVSRTAKKRNVHKKGDRLTPSMVTADELEPAVTTASTSNH